jgi:hypothetical protein
MPTAFLIAWALATVALAGYLMYRDHRDETARFERAADDVQPHPERGLPLFLLERVFGPILIALFISAIVGGLAGAFLKVATHS